MSEFKTGSHSLCEACGGFFFFYEIPEYLSIASPRFHKLEYIQSQRIFPLPSYCEPGWQHDYNSFMYPNMKTHVFPMGKAQVSVTN